MALPFVSVIIVNYNGKDLLGTCLESLERLLYPSNRFEVILVDNHSADTSVVYVRKHFPWVKLVVSDKNLGFAGGNNLGAQHAHGEFIAFLNSDTEVHERWLHALVGRMKLSKNTAVVNGKSFLWYPFLPLEITSKTALKSEFKNSIDFEEVGVGVEKIILTERHLQPLIEYRDGFLEQEKKKSYRWSTGKSIILLPLHPTHKKVKFSLTLRSEKAFSGINTPLEIRLGGKLLKRDELNAHEVKQYSFSLDSKQFSKRLFWKIQNAGNIVFQDGYARDRGATIKDGINHYELNSTYFEKPKRLLGFCGNNSMIRTDVFTKLGMFDERFFMYYEDCELSARLSRSGYNMIYEPEAMLFHKHAATSEEWSSFFIFQTQKNHLAFLFLHFPWYIIFIEVLKAVKVLLFYTTKSLRWKFTNRWDIFDKVRERMLIQKQILTWVFQNIPQLIQDRKALNKKLRMPIDAYWKTLA
jgi:GT2 family glycosyltransferase